ncbi:unnamed protein product [Anisakis simplex]|uniref:Uncharacterized protein n=1 Tax=Anisakis simplex TaxID=6269 RepID=A0A0M3JUX4_ANISI|nr:unnamed protein product [Anisakis simplex]
MMSRSAVIRARYIPDVRGVNRYKHFHSPLIIEPAKNAGGNIVRERFIHELPHLQTGGSSSHPASGRFDSDLTKSNENGDCYLNVKGLSVLSSSSNISSSYAGLDHINTTALSVAAAKSSDESLNLSSSLPLLVSTTTKPLWANSGNNNLFSSLHSRTCADSISGGGLRSSLCKSAQNICTDEERHKRPKVLRKSRSCRSCHTKLSDAVDSSLKQQQQSSMNSTMNAKTSISLSPDKRIFASKSNISNGNISNNTSSSDDTKKMMAHLSKSDEKRLSRITASTTFSSATRIVPHQQHRQKKQQEQKQLVQVDDHQSIQASLQQITKQHSNASRNQKIRSQRMVNRKNFAILFVDCASSGRDKTESSGNSNTNLSSAITETQGTQTSEVVEEEKEKQHLGAIELDEAVKKALISEPVNECSLVCKATQTQFDDRVLLDDDEPEVDSDKLIDQRKELMDLIELALNETIDKRSRMMTNNFIASSLRKQAEIWRDAKAFITGILIPQSIRYANTNRQHNNERGERT